jgi:hypothetical protein
MQNHTDIPVLPPARSTARRLRRTLFLALALMAVLAAIWTGLWHFGASWLDRKVTEVMEREEAAGRSISCASREITGFPFSIGLRCDNPKLAMEHPSGRIALSAQRLMVSTGVGEPGRLIVEAEGPVAIEAPNIAEAEAQWRSFVASVTLDLRGFKRADLVVEGPSLRLRSGQNMIATNADHAELHAETDAKRPQDDAIAITGKVARLASPILDSLFGEASPADGDLEASVSHARAALQPGAEAAGSPLERWRLAGGAAHIGHANFTKGPVKLGLTGDLSLDEAHRLSGRVDASVEGADALAQRLPIPKMAVNLVKLSGGKLRVPVDLANGRVSASIGPVAITLPLILVPLY